MAKLTAERLRAVIHADPETGVFTRLVTTSPRAKAGDVAGSISNGYVWIRVDRCRYSAHRLMWLYVTGAWPVAEIDHINGVRSDNRFANLREATSSQNKANIGRLPSNTSGFKGVHWHRRDRWWQARIAIDGHRMSLGYYRTPAQAHAAYVAAAQRLHGEYGRVV